MILYEYEGKKLLVGSGIRVPNSQLVDSAGIRITIQAPFILKAQVLSGKRADAGGIVKVKNEKEKIKKLEELFKKIINEEKVEKVLIEEKVEFKEEFYISITYDTDTRGPVLTISEQGGTGVEDLPALTAGRQGEVKTFPINPITNSVILSGNEESLTNVRKDVSEMNRESTASRAEIFYFVQDDITKKLINLFFEADCLLLEINPLVRTKNGWVALDAKVKLDETAKKRHEEWNYPPRLVPGHAPTDREIEAKKIDETDYRGTAGSTYFDMDGDIAVLSSGGGVSLTAMDALINFGGKPANFTEYSGNPPREKVNKLTKIVLSKPNIKGLWVIGTVAANFTDIYETLSGFIEGLREAEKELNTKFEFPIVIRRGGPNESQAFEMLKKVKDFDLHLQGEEMSIAQSAKMMVDLAEEYVNKISN